MKSLLCFGTFGVRTLLVLMLIIETPCSVPTYILFLKGNTFLVLSANKPCLVVKIVNFLPSNLLTPPP